MILCGSSLRPPGEAGVDPLVRLASEGGFDGVGIGRSCVLPQASELLVAALRAGLAPGVLAGPLGERALTPGRRYPRLGAEAPDERQAAIALTRQSLELAGGAGMTVVALDFGPVTLQASATDVARLFARRELEDYDLDEGPLGAALRQRKGRTTVLADAVRWSLEALLPDAERRGMALAIELGVTPWTLPSPREALELIALFNGARLGVAFDPAKLMAMRALGLPLSDQRLTALRAATVLIVENDAVGVDVGFLPGLGERAEDLTQKEGFPAGVNLPVTVIGPPDVTDEEVTAAATLVRARYE